MGLKKYALALSLSPVLCSFPVHAAAGPPAAIARAAQSAPLFQGLDQSGKSFVLTAHKGQPIVLFFFCGCEACHRTAALWTRLQRAKVLATPPFGSSQPLRPLTAVVFAGDATQATSFAQATGLSSTGTVFVPDADMRITDLYHVAPCPRVFVIDRNGIIRYTNDHADDAPQQDTESVIVNRALTALRACVASK